MRGPRKRLDQIFPARKVTSNVSLPNFKKEFSPGIDKGNIYVGSVDPNAASRRGGNVCFGESRNVSTENNRLPVFPKCEGSYGRNYTTDSWLNRCHSRVPKFVPPRPVDSELNEDNLNGENFNRRRSAGVSKFVPPRPVGPKLEVDVFGKFSSRNPAGSPIGSRDDASSEEFAEKRKHFDDENFREAKKQRVDDDSEEDFVASTPPLDITNENTRAEKPGIFSQKMTVSQRSFWIDDKEICETFFDIDEEQMGMGETENGSGDLRLPERLEKTCSACAVEKPQGECENAGNNATFGTSEAVICFSVPGSPEDNFNQTRRENDLGSQLRSCVVRDGLCWIANPKNGESLVDQLSGIPKSEDNGSTVSPGAAFWHDSVESFDGILVSNVGRQVSEKVNLGRQNSAGVTRGNEIMRADARLHSQVVQVKEGDEVAMQQCTVEEDNNVESLLSIDGDTRAASRNAAGMCCDLPECRLESASACAKKFESEEGNQNTNVVKSKAQYKVELRKWLPPDMCAFFAKKGLTRLYQWQVECLQIDGVLDGRSLVYSASTSAGKSLVAELLMLRRVLSTGKKAMLVLPYVSLCCEKATHLQALLQPLGKRVRGFYGTQGGSSLPEDTSVAVCTIEKANSLMNKLLEQGRVSELCIVVIDELHMVGDEDRGYLLELLLTKIRYIKGCEEIIPSSKTQTRTTSSPECTVLQIVGMSATMANVFEVAKWLQAALYQTEFRPVPLEEFLKVGNTIFDKRMEIVRKIRESADLMGKDPDHVVELCHEVVSEGHSVLVFCSSRRGCETSARHIARHLPPFTVIKKTAVGPVDGAAAIEELRRCSAGLDPVLEDTLSAGVAYHHAGLTAEEREVVETCFKSGVVRVLVATSTLAAGVNLPARRVIFRQPKIGRDFVDATRYRQMAGRAGRAGIDSKGESILICKPEEAKRIMEMMKQECKALQSCLAGDKNGMTHALLEVVAGGIVQNSADVERYVRCTLLSATHLFEEVVKAAQDSLRWLCYKRFLEWNASAEIYVSTPLGRAAFSSSLSPEDSLIVFEDLAKAREGFVLASDLHLIYEVTPTYFDLEPDWGLFLQRYMDLSPIDQSVGNRVGVMEAFLLRMAHGAPILQHCSAGRSRGGKAAKGKLSPLAQKSRWKSPGGAQLSVDQLLRICKRFYAALMLSYLVQEVPLLEICKLFKVQKGALQGLQNSAGKFAGMVSAFCERLGWSDIKSLVDGFRKRVALGVKSEIVDLTEIPFVKSARARALFEAGLKSVQAVAEATIDELVSALFSNTSRKSQDQSCNEQQRLQVVIARKIKNAARQIALDRAEQSRAAAFSACQALGVQVDAGLALPSFAPFAPIDEEEANESR